MPPRVRQPLFHFPFKVIVTVEAVVHEHVVRDTQVKLNRVLHGQLEVTMPAESVRVSNEITTA